MKNDQFVSSSLVVKEYVDLNIQDDLFSAQNKTIAQLIEESEPHEEKTQIAPTNISNSG